MKVLLNLFIFSTLIMMSSANAENLKFGYVDVEVLLREAPQVEKINSKMLDRFGSKKSELEKIEKELKKMQENYKRNELVMTEDKLNDLKKAYVSKVQIFKQNEAILSREVATMRSQEVAVLQDSIRGVISDIASNEKYDFILSDGVLHANGSYNITEKVLVKLRALLKN